MYRNGKKVRFLFSGPIHFRSKKNKQDGFRLLCPENKRMEWLKTDSVPVIIKDQNNTHTFCALEKNKKYIPAFKKQNRVKIVTSSNLP